MRARLVFLCTFAFLLITAQLIWAQRQDGTITGEIRDPLGAAVVNAKVTATNEGTGVPRTTMSSSVGSFSFANVQVGSYTVKVEASGFAIYSRPGVEVTAARVTEVNAMLKVGSATEVVEVKGGAELVQLHSSQLSNTFEEKAVKDVPTVGGANASVLNLAVYLPNTTTQLGGTSGTGGSVGGLRGRYNSFTLDGSSNNDVSVSSNTQPVIGEAVQEFTVTTNQFAAEYGNAAGGQFNIVTKSGTNSLHGSAFWSTINRNLNAADNQEKALIQSGALTDKKRYDLNTGGGTVGGPIIKNKLFLFGGFQYSTRGSQPSAPSAESFTSAGLAALNGIAVDQQVKDLLAQFPLAGSSTRTITVSGTPVAVGPVTAVASSFYTQYDYLINADLNLTNHQLRWRYLKDRFRQPAFGLFPQSQFTSSSASDYRKAIFDDVWAVRPTLVNNFNASLSRNQFVSPLSGVAATYPTVVVTELSGLTVGAANNFPQSRTTNTYQISDSMTWVKGGHTFKFGGEFRWVTSPTVFLQNQRGQYSYKSLNELTLDLIPSNANATLQGIGSGAFSGNSINYAMYFQDDFKLTRRLTLNLGIRYDFFGQPAGAKLNALNAISTLPGTPLIFDVPKEDHNNFAPRVGFAWDPTGSGKWAVRGGFGVAYDTVPFNFQLNGAPPQKQAILQPPTACAGILAPPAPWCTSGTGFLAQGAMKLPFIPPSTQALARGLTGNLIAPMISPKVLTWSLSVQRELFRDTSLEIRYVGTRAVELPVQEQLNSITAFELGAPSLPTYLAIADIPAVVPATAPTLQQVFVKTPSSSSLNRRYGAAGFQDIVTWIGPVGNSRYHAGSVDFYHRFSHGVMGRANWTWSRNQDNSTNDLFTSNVNPRRPENWTNLSNEWGRSALDVRHKIALSWVYDIPRAKVDNALLRGLLNGWQYNGSWLFQLGQPITPISVNDANGNGDNAGDRVIINPNANNLLGSDANLVCRNAATGATSIGPTITAATSTACGSRANVVGYVATNPAAHFIRAGLGAITNSGRNIVNSPGFNLWNMSIFKNTSIKERYVVQFRAEAYDVFNHRNFTLADSSVFGSTANATSASYAAVSTTGFLNQKQFNGGSRTMQLGLKVTF
jgi:hypothetical protein